MNNDQEPIDPEKSTTQLLQEIATGLTNPKLFDIPTRQKCVELLRGEGQLIPTLSQLLKCSEKTISRDIKAINARRAFSPSREFATGFVGEIYQKAMIHHDFFVRQARTQNLPPALRIRAEFAAWEVLKELIEKFQTLGYLPLKPTEFQVIQQDEEKSFAEIEQMLVQLTTVAQETGNANPQLEESIKSLQVDLEKAKLSHKATQLCEQQRQQENPNLEEQKNG